MEVGRPLYDLWNFFYLCIGEIIKSPIHREVLLIKHLFFYFPSISFESLFLIVHFNFFDRNDSGRAIELFSNQFPYLIMEIRFSRVDIHNNNIALSDFLLAMAEFKIYEKFSHYKSLLFFAYFVAFERC
jgi:hypothetical protein